MSTITNETESSLSVHCQQYIRSLAYAYTISGVFKVPRLDKTAGEAVYVGRNGPYRHNYLQGNRLRCYQEETAGSCIQTQFQARHVGAIIQYGHFLAGFFYIPR
jgi:hypothetical protein